MPELCVECGQRPPREFPEGTSFGVPMTWAEAHGGEAIYCAPCFARDFPPEDDALRAGSADD